MRKEARLKYGQKRIESRIMQTIKACKETNISIVTL